MRAYRPNLTGKIHPEAEREIRFLQDEIDRLKSLVSSAKLKEPIAAIVTAPPITNSALLGVLAQPELGSGTTDPQLQTVSTAAGTVTSVSASATPTSVFDIAVSTATSTPAIALSMDNQAANIMLAGPSSGGSAQPAFRAPVAADIYGIADVLLASASININSNTAQDIYTVPSGKTLVVTRAVVRLASADISGYGSAVDVFDSSSGDAVIDSFDTYAWTQLLDGDHFYPSTGFTGVNAPYIMVAAGDRVQARPLGVFGSAATVVMDVFGYLF